MPKKRKQDTQFKAGQSGNPAGRPKLPTDVLEARKLNRVELDRILNKYLWLDLSAAKAALKNPVTPMMEMMVGSIVVKAAENGDHSRLDFVLNRLVGKIKDEIEVTIPKPFFIRHLDGSVTELGSTKSQYPEEGIFNISANG